MEIKYVQFKMFAILLFKINGKGILIIGGLMDMERNGQWQGWGEARGDLGE